MQLIKEDRKTLTSFSANDTVFGKVMDIVPLSKMILEHLTEEDLDRFALVSQYCLVLAQDDLRFRRTGTIVIKKSMEDIPTSFWERLNKKVFCGNRTHLVVVLDTLKYFPVGAPSFVLEHVRELDLQPGPYILSLSKRRRGCVDIVDVCAYFNTMLPALDCVDLSPLAEEIPCRKYLNGSHSLCMLGVSKFCCEPSGRGLSKPSMLQPKRYNRRLDVLGKEKAENLKEFHVDPIDMYFDCPIAAYCEEDWFEIQGGHKSKLYLLQDFPNLERVTLSHARCRCTDSGEIHVLAMPQEALMKFVRHMPKLNWFRSDLTPENIVMLQAERPEVHFC